MRVSVRHHSYMRKMHTHRHKCASLWGNFHSSNTYMRKYTPTYLHTYIFAQEFMHIWIIFPLVPVCKWCTYIHLHYIVCMHVFECTRKMSYFHDSDLSSSKIRASVFISACPYIPHICSISTHVICTAAYIYSHDPWMIEYTHKWLSVKDDNIYIYIIHMDVCKCMQAGHLMEYKREGCQFWLFCRWRGCGNPKCDGAHLQSRFRCAHVCSFVLRIFLLYVRTYKYVITIT